MSYFRLNSKSRDSERTVARKLGLSRTTLRGLVSGIGNPRLSTLTRIAELQDKDLLCCLRSRVSPDTKSSTAYVSDAVHRGGFETWKIHFMNFVDEFRRHQDISLVLLPPVEELDPKLRALLASMVTHLCAEIQLPAPRWALAPHFLRKPWFVSNIENLKALAIVESPTAFRMNNIFVLGNFLERV